MRLGLSFLVQQSMVSEPNLVLYACIAKGTTVLADYTSADQDLVPLVSQCLENIPHFHLRFSHTVGNRIYAILIGDHFVYFTIVDQELGKLQAFQFLEWVKDAFLKTFKKSLKKGLDSGKWRSYQEDFSPVFRRLLDSNELRSLKSPDVSAMNQNGSADPRMSGKTAISVPLLGKTSTKSKKKKKIPGEEMIEGTRDITIENKVDVSDDVMLSREFSASLQKNGAYIGHTGRHHAKKMWRRHVCTVLLIDLVICCILFGVWLFICKGFECIR